MSDDKFSARFEVKPSAIPDRILKDFENIKHSSTIKLLPVTKNQGNTSGAQKTGGLSMLELSKFIDDPFWIRLRKTLVCFVILLFVTLFTISIFIVVTTPACEEDYDMKKKTGRTRECKSDEECAAILNTSCMSDPRDYKMRCLCRDSSAPINGACPNRPRAVGSPCKMDNECIEGSECKSMNITVTSFKTCQCKEGFMSRDGYCSSAFYNSVPSVFSLLATTMVVLFINRFGSRF